VGGLAGDCGRCDDQKMENTRYEWVTARFLCVW
jgi:hypothetical protein